MVAALDPEHEVFVIHIAALSMDLNNEVHPSKRAQIAHLKADKVSIKVPNKYADFVDVFSPKLAAKLSEHTKINNYIIKLVDDQQPLYGPIYSLELVELVILKAYIENNQANSFIKSSKSLARTPIPFDKKLGGSLKLCIDY